MNGKLLTEIFGNRIGIARVGDGGFRRWIDLRYTVARRGRDVDDTLGTMLSRAFEHRKGAVDIGAKIGFWILYRRNHVRPGGQMKYALSPGTGGNHRWLIRDITLYDFKRRISCVLIE